MKSYSLQIPLKEHPLEGDLVLPAGARSIIVFAHGSGSSRLSPRNQFVSQTLNKAGFATLLFDLLTKEEEQLDAITANYRFDIDLLTHRLVQTTDWVTENPDTKGLSIGYFGASTGAAAALLAASLRPKNVKAVVSRGGRPDLAEAGLSQVRAPTLLIVGGMDYVVIQMNEAAFQKLSCVKKLLIISGAGHLFEEPGKLDEVAKAAEEWFSSSF